MRLHLRQRAGYKLRQYTLSHDERWSKICIHELRFFPWPLHDWEMQVLEDAGAYVSIKAYAQNSLLKAEVLENDLPGLDFLNCCIRGVVRALKHDVLIRVYHHSTPRGLHHGGRILLAAPRPCTKCTQEKC